MASMGDKLSEHVEGLAADAGLNIHEGVEQCLLDVADDVRELEAELQVERAKVAIMRNAAVAIRELACRYSMAFTYRPEYAAVSAVISSDEVLEDAARCRVAEEEEWKRQRDELVDEHDDGDDT